MNAEDRFEMIVGQFIEQLYEQDETAAMAYQTLRKEHIVGNIQKSVIGQQMRKHFQICPVPEDMFTE